MLSLYLNAVGIVAPGISSWDEAAAIFTQVQQYVPEPVPRKLETLLPANEKRRASRVIQLALNAAQQIGEAQDISQCLQVFSSAHGDITTFHQISLALAMAGRPVSPTRFHNSVHNAPAGYCSIATQSQTASTSITAETDSFAAGLLEAAVQLNSSDNNQGRDCLLVCYDEVPAIPFRSLLNISEEFACALRFARENEYDTAIARLDIGLSDTPLPLKPFAAPALEQLHQSNPQAASLSVLKAATDQDQNTLSLDYLQHFLHINVTPLAAT